MRWVFPWLLIVGVSIADPIDYYPTGAMNPAAHVALSFVATLMANQLIWATTGIGKNKRLLAAGVAGLSVGLLKEAVDSYQGGLADPDDVAADCLGVWAGMMLIYRF